MEVLWEDLQVDAEVNGSAGQCAHPVLLRFGER